MIKMSKFHFIFEDMVLFKSEQIIGGKKYYKKIKWDNLPVVHMDSCEVGSSFGIVNCIEEEVQPYFYDHVHSCHWDYKFASLGNNEVATVSAECPPS